MFLSPPKSFNITGSSYPPEKIILSKENFDALVEKLNEPPQYNEKIARLLSRKAPWDND